MLERLFSMAGMVVLPCWVLTFLFGPVGLALYLLVKLAMRRSVGAGEEIAE